jgi:hypothetical protein
VAQSFGGIFLITIRRLKNPGSTDRILARITCRRQAGHTCGTFANCVGRRSINIRFNSTKVLRSGYISTDKRASVERTGPQPRSVPSPIPFCRTERAGDDRETANRTGPPVRNSPPTQVLGSHCRRCPGAMTRSTLSIDSRDVVEDTLAGLGELVRSILMPLWAGVHYVECSHPACAHIPA